MSRTLATVLAASAAAFVLTACTPDVPPVPEAPSPEYNAALLEEQYERVFADTFEELAAADAARDPELFSARIGADAVDVRTAEYLTAAVDDGPSPTVIPDEIQAAFVSSAEEWPRILVGVTENPGESLTPVVMLWIQDDIRTPYQLRAWAPMIPGATLPQIAGAPHGTSQVSLGDESVQPSPRAALEGYLELLREGASSELEEQYAPDTYRQRLFAARATLSEAADDAGGDYIDTFQPQMARTYALKTADGGTLVFAPIEMASSFSVEDATVSVSEFDEPLLDAELDDKVTHSYKDMVVMYVPGPGVDAKPAVVAAAHQLVRVSDS